MGVWVLLLESVLARCAILWVPVVWVLGVVWVVAWPLAFLVGWHSMLLLVVGLIVVMW